MENDSDKIIQQTPIQQPCDGKYVCKIYEMLISFYFSQGGIYYRFTIFSMHEYHSGQNQGKCVLLSPRFSESHLSLSWPVGAAIKTLPSDMVRKFINHHSVSAFLLISRACMGLKSVQVLPHHTRKTISLRSLVHEGHCCAKVAPLKVYQFSY